MKGGNVPGLSRTRNYVGYNCKVRTLDGFDLRNISEKSITLKVAGGEGNLAVALGEKQQQQ